MRDGDHLAEVYGYTDPMHSLLQAILLNSLSFTDSGCRLLGIELTQEERLSATTPDLTRKLLLNKLQERF